MNGFGKVSIIIPVYNVQEYLEECLLSVINQTYVDLEIVIVDDGSTDKSASICDFFSEKDERIKVIHRENGGVATARNTALEIITGDFVFFLDSDDYLSENAIEELLLVQNETDSDIVICSSFSNSEKKESGTGFYECVDEIELLKRMLLNKNISHAPWAKLFKSMLWTQYRFPDVLVGEDYAILYHVVSGSSKVAIFKDELYFYRIRQGSLMRSNITEEHFLLLDVSDKVTSYICEKYNALVIPALRLNLVTYTKMLKNILDLGFDKYIDVQKRIIEHVKKNASLVIFSKEVRIKDKVKMFSLFISKKFFYVCYCMGDLKNNVR